MKAFFELKLISTAVQRLNALKPAHRTSIVGLIATLVLFALVFGGLLPAWDYRSTSVARFQELSGAIEWMQREKDLAKRTASKQAQIQQSGSDLSVVSKLATESGLTQHRVNSRQAGGVTVTIQDGNYRDLIAWLRKLSEHSYTVAQARVDSSRAGRVNATLGVRRL